MLIASVLLLASTGCHALSRQTDTGSASSLPIASEQGQPKLLSSSQLPSQRVICIETADKIAQQGHVDEAITLYERAEALEPDSPKLDRQLASLYASAGKHDRAIERYRRLVTNDPENGVLRNNLAWTLVDASRFQEALDEANRGLAITPNHPRLSSTLAVIHYRTGNRQAALEQFTKQYGPAIAHHNLAILDIEFGNEASARQHVEAAMRLGGSDQTRELLAALNQQDPQTSPVTRQ